MDFLRKITERLNRPFPCSQSFLEDFKGLVTAGIIVTLILYVLKPFGMSYYPGSHLKLAAYFGLVSILSGLVVHVIELLVFKKPYHREKYRLKNWIIEMLILLIAISFGNIIFSHYFFNDDITVYSYFSMLLCTCLLGAFPVVIFGLQRQIKLEKLNAATANDLSESIETTTPQASSEETILAVEAMQNYVNIYKLQKGNLEKQTERKTLKTAQEELSTHGLTKCHRSYLVNLKNVNKISGNAQGLKLTLSHANCPEIPVSRSYIAEVKSKLN